VVCFGTIRNNDMIRASYDSLVTMHAARIVIMREAKDPFFPGPSIFRAKHNRKHRNSIGGK